MTPPRDLRVVALGARPITRPARRDARTIVALPDVAGSKVDRRDGALRAALRDRRDCCS